MNPIYQCTILWHCCYGGGSVIWQTHIRYFVMFTCWLLELDHDVVPMIFFFLLWLNKNNKSFSRMGFLGISLLFGFIGVSMVFKVVYFRGLGIGKPFAASNILVFFFIEFILFSFWWSSLPLCTFPVS